MWPSPWCSPWPSPGLAEGLRDSGDPVPASASSQPVSSRAEEPASQASSEQASSAEASSQASSAPESAQESSAPQNDAAYGEPLPETERVRSDYFDDAVFVGDSITSGISLYQIMDNADVLADTGVNFDTIYTKESVRQEDGTRIPIMDALAQKQYAKVYVMLGGNEVGGRFGGILPRPLRLRAGRHQGHAAQRHHLCPVDAAGDPQQQLRPGQRQD